MTDAAQIIAFPERAEDRLRHALRRLDAALAEQRAAVGAWRGELGSLADATAKLDSSLSSFRGNLDSLAVTARQVDQEAKRLGRTAELMEQLAQKG